MKWFLTQAGWLSIRYLCGRELNGDGDEGWLVPLNREPVLALDDQLSNRGRLNTDD